MSSVKCPQCNLTNWSTALTCKRCGGFLQPGGENFVDEQNSFAEQDSVGENRQTSDGQNYPAQWSPSAEQQSYQETNRQNHGQPEYQNYQSTNYGYYKPANLKSGLAVASMVLGILGFVTSIFLIGVLLAPVGLILGIVALVKVNRQPDVYGGKGFAIAGVVTGSMIVLFVPIIAAIAIPNLLAARRAANEGGAIAAMRAIHTAESTYMRSSYGKCGDVKTLIATKLLDVNLASGEKNGYRFMVINLPAGGCEIFATPVSTSYGNRSFYYSTEDGVLRGGPKKGLPADKTDFPVGGAVPKIAEQKSKES